MAETLGDVVERLCVASIRLWNLEDTRRERANAEDLTVEEARTLLNKVSKVNKERNSLIDQFNAGMRVLVDKAVNKDTTFELTAEELLGTGKNKHYKGEDRK